MVKLTDKEIATLNYQRVYVGIAEECGGMFGGYLRIFEGIVGNTNIHRDNQQCDIWICLKLGYISMG
jgi:hypothetical protein